MQHGKMHDTLLLHTDLFNCYFQSLNWLGSRVDWVGFEKYMPLSNVLVSSITFSAGDFVSLSGRLCCGSRTKCTGSSPPATIPLQPRLFRNAMTYFDSSLFFALLPNFGITTCFTHRLVYLKCHHDSNILVFRHIHNRRSWCFSYVCWIIVNSVLSLKMGAVCRTRTNNHQNWRVLGFLQKAATHSSISV